MIHQFEEAIKGLTGLPPFHNFDGGYWDGMSAAEKLCNEAKHSVRCFADEIDVACWCSENIKGKFCVLGGASYFENPNDALHFKLVWGEK